MKKEQPQARSIEKTSGWVEELAPIKMTDLFVDFPHNRHRRTVRIAETAKVYVFKNHCERHNVARNVLWYTDTEYERMKFEADTSRRFQQLASSIQAQKLSQLRRQESPFVH